MAIQDEQRRNVMTNPITKSMPGDMAAKVTNDDLPFHPESYARQKLGRSDKSESESHVTLLERLGPRFLQATQGPLTLSNGVTITRVPTMGNGMDMYSVSSGAYSLKVRPKLGMVAITNAAGQSTAFQHMDPAQQSAALTLLRAAVSG